MNNWKINDKNWVKTRKEAWKEVKPQMARMAILDKDDKQILKKWFFNGPEGDRNPLVKITAAPLFELWLHPDQSDECWLSIKDKYADWQWADAKYYFKNYAKGMGCDLEYDTGFSGLEHRLFYFFNPDYDKFNRKDYKTEEEYRGAIKKFYRGTMQNIDWFFDEKNPSPYDVRFCQLERWRKAFISAYHDCKELEWTVEWVEKILGSREVSNNVHVDFAEKINTVFDDPELPQEAKNRIEDLRKKYRGKQ